MKAPVSAALSLGQGEAALVWFPAVGDVASSFGRSALKLANRSGWSLRILAFDPPGYGPASRDPLPSFAFLYDWAAGLADELGRNGTPLILAGNSSGADLALAAAVRSNARVVGCVFVCWPDWRLGRAPTSRDLCPRDVPELDRLLRRSWHRPPALADEQKRALLARLATARYRDHVASFAVEEHGHMLDQLGVPLHFVGGRSDRLVPPALLEESADAHRCPLALIDGAGHYPQLEQAAELADLLAASARRWLRRYQETA